MILEYLPSIIAWLAVLAAWGLYLLTRDAIHKAPETVRDEMQRQVEHGERPAPTREGWR